MQKILFVDDEQRLLDGLSRMLRPQRQRWELVFALGGEAAIAELSREAFDIVVSDMRMPGVDGLTVLRYARDHSPRTARIALSGQTDLEIMAQSLSVVHQFLSKPCSPSTLCAVIERISGLQQVLDHPVLRMIVGRMGEAPTLPRTYQRFVEAIDDPDVTIRQVVAIIEDDVALAARCLQVANSAYFGQRRRIETLDQAVAYLGVSTLRAMVLSSSVFSSFQASGRLTHAELERLERHAVMVANTARLLVADETTRQQAFMAGMLHDIGQLMLSTVDPDLLVGLNDRETGEAETVGEALTQISHAEVGAYLLGLWGLPHSIVEAVAFHHHPERIQADRSDVLWAVYAANELVKQESRPDEPATDAPASGLHAYLESIGCADRLPELRAIAAGVVTREGHHRE